MFKLKVYKWCHWYPVLKCRELLNRGALNCRDHCMTIRNWTNRKVFNSMYYHVTEGEPCVRWISYRPYIIKLQAFIPHRNHRTRVLWISSVSLLLVHQRLQWPLKVWIGIGVTKDYAVFNVATWNRGTWLTALITTQVGGNSAIVIRGSGLKSEI